MVAPTLQKLVRQINKSLKLKVICGKQSLIDSKFEQSSNVLKSTWQIVINKLDKNNVLLFSHMSLMVNVWKVSHPKQ